MDVNHHIPTGQAGQLVAIIVDLERGRGLEDAQTEILGVRSVPVLFKRYHTIVKVVMVVDHK